MDASPGMMTPVILAQTTVKTNGRQVPILFELTFDPARVELTHPFAVKAVIRSNRQTHYESPREPRVIVLSTPSAADLLVLGLQREAPTAGSLEGTTSRVEDLGGAGVIDNAEATLEFLVGGGVAGKRSCIRFFGTAISAHGATAAHHVLRQRQAAAFHSRVGRKLTSSARTSALAGAACASPDRRSACRCAQPPRSRQTTCQPRADRLIPHRFRFGLRVERDDHPVSAIH